MSEVIFEKNIKFIGKDIFKNCNNIKIAQMSVDMLKDINRKELNDVFLTDGEIVTEMLFAECVKLKKVKLCNSIQGISQNAFYGCWELEDIDIGNGVDYIAGSI